MKLRYLFKDVAIYSIGDILLKAAAFMTLPVYTRLFAPEDYGIWNFITTVVGLLSGVLILGGDSAYARFFFEAKTLRERQVITSTWLGFLALWSGGVTVLCMPLGKLFSQWSFGTDQYNVLFTLSLLATPITLINLMCGQILRNQFNAQLFIVLNALSTLLSVGFSLYAVIILNLGLVGVFSGLLFAAVVMLPIRLWTARLMLCLLFSRQVLRNLLAYGIPLVPVSLAYWVFGVSDRIVLGKLSTLDQVGLYAVANTVAGVLGLVNGALGQAWTPHLVHLYEEQPEMASAFFGQVMTYILVGFGIMCVGMTIFAHEILMVLSTPAFYPAALAIGPLTLGFMAYASTQITAASISLTKQTKYFAIFSWIAALLNLGLNILLVPNWGMIAASWSTAVSYIFLTIAYLVISQRLWLVMYETQRALIAIGLTLGFVIVGPLLPISFTAIVNLALKSAYCLTYIALLLVFQVINQREWKALHRVLQELSTYWAEKAV